MLVLNLTPNLSEYKELNIYVLGEAKKTALSILEIDELFFD